MIIDLGMGDPFSFVKSNNNKLQGKVFLWVKLIYFQIMVDECKIKLEQTNKQKILHTSTDLGTDATPLE